MAEKWNPNKKNQLAAQTLDLELIVKKQKQKLNICAYELISWRLRRMSNQLRMEFLKQVHHVLHADVW